MMAGGTCVKPEMPIQRWFQRATISHCANIKGISGPSQPAFNAFRCNAFPEI